MKKQTLVATALVASIVVTFAIVLHGGLLHVTLAMVAVALGLVGVGIAALRWRSSRSSSLWIARYVALPCAGVVGSVPLGYAYLDYEIGRTYEAFEPVIREIVDTKARSGSFPTSIDEALRKADIPWIVGSRIYYFARGDSCDLAFSYSGGFIDLHCYNFEKKEWIRD